MVLGCTHYPLLRPQIQAFLGPKVQLVDPAESLADQAAQLLQAKGLASAEPCAEPIHCHASGPADSLLRWAVGLACLDLGPIEQIDIHKPR